MSAIFPLLMAIAITGLVQYHSVEFWVNHVGLMGVLWSILLEAGALFLWWQERVILRLIGLVATCLLLAGPIYQLVQPIQHQKSKITVTANQILQQEKVIEGFRIQLKTYLKNSESRSGWLKPIKNTQRDIDTALDRLYELQQKQEKSGDAEMLDMITWLQITVLIVLVIIQITAVRHLRKCSFKLPDIARSLISDAQRARWVAHNLVSQEGNMSAAARVAGVDRRELGRLITKNPDRAVKPETIHALLMLATASSNNCKSTMPMRHCDEKSHPCNCGAMEVDLC